MNKVLTALSGGVDSAVCVHLLKEQGYQVQAVVMNMSPLHVETIEAARAAAEALEIPLTVLDLRREFEEQVIRPFLDEYSRGRTPNPCVICNPGVKFRHLLALAEELGCGWAATGHYARIRCRNGEFQLLRAASLKRDQSYMLYRLDQQALSQLLFPLGTLEKDEVREIARRLGLAAAEKPDSQENCFISDKNYADYIERRRGPFPPGEWIAPDGTPCGTHRGIVRYTVGQRRGLGIALGQPVFVRRIDPDKNRIYLAFSGEDTITETEISGMTTISGKPLSALCQNGKSFPAAVKIRSAAVPAEAEIFPMGVSGARVVFAEPQRAAAPGQSLVIYQKDQVIGGGWIE